VKSTGTWKRKTPPLLFAAAKATGIWRQAPTHNNAARRSNGNARSPRQPAKWAGDTRTKNGGRACGAARRYLIRQYRRTSSLTYADFADIAFGGSSGRERAEGGGWPYDSGTAGGSAPSPYPLPRRGEGEQRRWAATWGWPYAAFTGGSSATGATVAPFSNRAVSRGARLQTAQPWHPAITFSRRVYSPRAARTATRGRQAGRLNGQATSVKHFTGGSRASRSAARGARCRTRWRRPRA